MPVNFQFEYPWLFILAPLPLLIYWFVPPIRIRKTALNHPYFERISVISNQRPRKAAYIKRRGIIASILMMAIWACLLGSLASPVLIGTPEKRIKKARNFLIAADLSFSMAEKDWIIDGKKSTRWEAVKDIMQEFVVKRKSDRMGLIFFATNTYVQAPFTSDLNTISHMLDEADVGMAGQSTNIGKAIVQGVDLFERDSISSKVMLLLTDGVDSGLEILPLDAAKMAKNDSVIIYTVGIGDPNKSSSDLDETTLKEIAEMTGGKYFRAKDAASLEAVYEELEAIQPIEYESETYTPKTLLYYYPLAIALGIGFLLVLMSDSILLIKRIRN